MYINYSISDSKGLFYEKSKDPKEGFEKVVYGTDNKVTYHKYVNKVQGVLESVEINSIPDKKLTFLDVVLKSGGDIVKVSTPLKRANGNFTDAATCLISCLFAADFNEEVTLSSKKSGDYLNIYCNYVNRLNEDGKGMSAGYVPNSAVPRADKSQDPLTKQDVWDWTKVTAFWTGKLTELLERSKSEGTTSTHGDSKTPGVQNMAPPVVKDLDDDLPF